MSNSETTWKFQEKILFRFFFIFFSLEIFTQDFTGNWFGGNLFIWDLGAKIFTPPFLWLNGHIFHFNYHPEDWTTFSGSLVLVRDIAYLFLSLIICLTWTIVDGNRKNYSKLNFWFGKVLCICLACTIFAYGITKVFPVQMMMPGFVDLHKPVGDLTPFDLLWLTMGYGKPYQIFTGIGEVLGAVLILFRPTKPIGLIILFIVLLNVVMLNYTYVIGVLEFSILLLLVTIYLLFPYFKNLWLFFFSNQFVNQSINLRDYKISTPWKKYTVTSLGLIVVATTFILNTNAGYSRYTRFEAINNSRNYSAVKFFVINNDTLKNHIEGDTIRWRFWSERVVDEKLMVTLCVMNTRASRSYFLKRDSVGKILTLMPVNKKDTSQIKFTWNDLDKINWHLDGVVKGQHITADLQKINPDSTLRLFQVKREIFAMDKED